ncbi:TetR/AcrR family transcriptional regulator [Streptomyces sulphureus]|uniref:TetR/AcrR family transcriptional regulator n=1 Tax=Streptomyces sulphureus TaxID=47758 RepID=UPI000375B2C5|nr:TetR/AcrR family transcriptional regulator [Streptomyces sulphureus]
MTAETTQRPDRIVMTPGALRVREAAGRLFYERGIHAVGVDLIAAEAGVTKKTLYDRFGSKDGIVVEYLAERDDRWRALLADRVEAAGSPSDRVRAVFDAAEEWAGENSPRGCSMVNAHAEISDPAHPAFALIEEAKRWMLSRFTELAAEVAPESAAELGRSLLLLYEGALVAYGMRLFDGAFDTARARAEELLSRAAG